jgi:hypothetical protein
LDNLLKPTENILTRNSKEVERRRHERRLTILNGYDPFTESKYWDTYMKYKNIREEHGRRFEETLKKNKEINEQIALQRKQVTDLLDKSQKEILDGIIEDELNFKVSESTDNVKDLSKSSCLFIYKLFSH